MRGTAELVEFCAASGDGKVRVEKLARHDGQITPLDIHQVVEPPHLGVGDQSAEFGERGLELRPREIRTCTRNSHSRWKPLIRRGNSTQRLRPRQPSRVAIAADVLLLVLLQQRLEAWVRAEGVVEWVDSEYWNCNEGRDR